MLARFIHDRSGRGAGRFLRFPLTAVPDDLRHAELFGYVRGAFTGADRDRVGAVESAHQGTLFLDEIGLASPGFQGALLTVLDDSRIRRLGEERERTVDTRIIAATNEDLEGQVREGLFRRDLLARFGFFQLELPPLRERNEDILPLFRSFLSHDRGAGSGAVAVEIDKEVEDILLAALWPDNVRELLNVARYALVHLSPGGRVGVDHLPRPFLRAVGAALGKSDPASRLRNALRFTGGNRSKAAEMLGMGRATFYRHMKQEGLASS